VSHIDKLEEKGKFVGHIARTARNQVLFGTNISLLIYRNSTNNNDDVFLVMLAKLERKKES
jgi:hypothetical protein